MDPVQKCNETIDVSLSCFDAIRKMQESFKWIDDFHAQFDWIANFTKRVELKLPVISALHNKSVPVLKINSDLGAREAKTPSIYNATNNHDFVLSQPSSDYRDEHHNYINKENTSGDRYFNEKSRGGKASYQRNAPMRLIVNEVCAAELLKKHYSSARKLCFAVIDIIKNKHFDILKEYQPYKLAKPYADWWFPTLYLWCNEILKAHKESRKSNSYMLIHNFALTIRMRR